MNFATDVGDCCESRPHLQVSAPAAGNGNGALAEWHTVKSYDGKGFLSVLFLVARRAHFRHRHSAVSPRTDRTPYATLNLEREL